MNEIMVSVLCATFNQEKYIKNALDSFLAQKTNFAIEVLINDDASTDHTAEIIREYAERYPDIIKPIYQTENQYSKGVQIIRKLVLPKAQGKYVAWCEGDDYWTDPLKLQKQVDYLEEHPECALCTHNAVRIDAQGDYLSDYIVSEKSRIIPTEEVLLGGGGFCATASIVARRNMAQETPDYFNIVCMDLVWQMYFASKGTTYCLADSMSAYRVSSSGSWTEKMASSTADKHIAHLNRLIRLRDAFDKETNYKYHSTISKINDARTIEKYILEVNSNGLKEKSLRHAIKALDRKQRIQIFLIKYFPNIYKSLAAKRGWVYLH